MKTSAKYFGLVIGS